MDCINKIWITPNGHERKIQVPCGKCIPCCHSKRLQWSFRINQEAKASHSAHFVTLTYTNSQLKLRDYQLCKKDVQLYLKRLRKKLTGQRIRYYAVGEYGSKSGRAHYHLILFNCDETTIRSSWTDPKTKKPIGIVHVGKVTEASIQYVLKYLVQPETKQWYAIETPFTLMSRGYGIGAHYLSDNMMEWHRSGNKTYTLNVDGQKGVLPKYYWQKIWYEKEQLQSIKDKHKWNVIKRHREILREWRKEFPNNWKEKRQEHLNAQINNIKSKIVKTQSL